MDPDEPVQQRPQPPPTSRTRPPPHPEAVRGGVDLAMLGPAGGQAVPGIPPAAVHHLRAQPDPEEVVGQVVVMPDRARRLAHRGQPPGVVMAGFRDFGGPHAGLQVAATSPTVPIRPRPRRTSIGGLDPGRISTSVMIPAAVSGSMPRSFPASRPTDMISGHAAVLAIDSRSAASRSVATGTPPDGGPR